MKSLIIATAIVAAFLAGLKIGVARPDPVPVYGADALLKPDAVYLKNETWWRKGDRLSCSMVISGTEVSWYEDAPDGHHVCHNPFAGRK